MKERRQHQRSAVSLTAELTPAGSTSLPMTATSANISPGGLYLLAADNVRVKVGDDVDLCLTVSPDAGRIDPRATLAARARVVRIEPPSHADPVNHRAGIACQFAAPPRLA